MKISMLAAATLIILTLTLGGCGGGGAEVSSQITTTTMGQELQDLETAFNKGLLSESEYKDQRKAILKRYK